MAHNPPRINGHCSPLVFSVIELYRCRLEFRDTQFIGNRGAPIIFNLKGREICILEDTDLGQVPIRQLQSDLILQMTRSSCGCLCI